MKKSTLIVSFLILWAAFACREPEEITPNPPIDNNTPRPPKGVVNTNVFGLVVDERENPVAGAKVVAAGRTVFTDANGIYTMSDVQLDGDRAYLAVSKEGYFNGFRIFEPYKDKMTMVPTLKLIERKLIGTINAASGGKAGETGGIQIELPADAIEGYTDEVSVTAAYINPTAPDFMARIPGDLTAVNAEGNTGALISYGMGHVELLGTSGQKLNIKEGKKAKMMFPIPESALFNAPPTMEMWSWNEEDGIWKSEGMGVREGAYYVGEVSHFSIWNFDIWNPFRYIPTSIKWFIMYLLGKISPDEDPEALERILDERQRGEREVAVQVRRRDSGIIVYNKTFRYPTRTNRDQGYTEYEEDMRLPEGVGPQENLEIRVYPIQPGGSEYPVNEKYKPTTGEVPSPAPDFVQEDDFEMDVKTYDADFTKSPTSKVESIIPPVEKIDAKGAYLINVNGTAADCNGNPLKKGYAHASLRGGGKIIGQAYSVIFNDGRFTIQYHAKQKDNVLINEVVLSVFDTESGKRSQDITVNVNPSAPYMLPTPVNVCLNPDDPAVNPTGKVYDGDLQFTTQAQVDAFADSAYTEVTGNLFFNGFAITDLSRITTLKKAGSLTIDLAVIESLGGLTELEDIRVSIRIQRCSNLRNIAFPKLNTTSLIGGLYVNTNPILESITIPNLETISASGQEFSILRNEFLHTISLPRLKSLGNASGFTLSDTRLKNVDFLRNVVGNISGYFTLDGNTELEDIGFLENIKSKRGVYVRYNAKLKSLKGISLADGNTDYLVVQNNPMLEDVSAVSNAMESSYAINFSKNPKVKSIVFNTLESISPGGSIGISDELGLEEIAFPKLKTLGGSMALVDLPSLTKLEFPVLEIAQGTINFQRLTKIETLDLPQLKTVQTLLMSDLIALKNLDGFNNLETITNTFSMIFYIQTAIAMESINGFNKLVSAQSISLHGGNLNESQNNIKTINGFQALEDLFVLTIVRFYNVQEVRAFGSLKAVTNELNFNQISFKNFDFLGSLEKIGSFLLSQNPGLESLSGLKNLKQVNNLNFGYQPLLRNLDGLEGLTNISINISIVHHTLLENLNGLANLSGNTTNLNITNNPKLGDLCGLTKLVKEGNVTGSFQISNNLHNPNRSDLVDGKCSNL